MASCEFHVTRSIITMASSTKSTSVNFTPLSMVLTALLVTMIPSIYNFRLRNGFVPSFPNSHYEPPPVTFTTFCVLPTGLFPLVSLPWPVSICPPPHCGQPLPVRAPCRLFFPCFCASLFAFATNLSRFIAGVRLKTK